MYEAEASLAALLESKSDVWRTNLQICTLMDGYQTPVPWSRHHRRQINNKLHFRSSVSDRRQAHNSSDYLLNERNTVQIDQKSDAQIILLQGSNIPLVGEDDGRVVESAGSVMELIHLPGGSEVVAIASSDCSQLDQTGVGG
jgi:hypothetical protein